VNFHIVVKLTSYLICNYPYITIWYAGGAGAWSNNTCMVTGRESDSDHGTYVQAEYNQPGHFGILLVSYFRTDIISASINHIFH